jgi:hypothetical protein
VRIFEKADEMRLKLDLYSGRHNPTWTLSKRAGTQAFELMNDLGLVKVANQIAFPSNLGYRGLRILLPLDVQIKYRMRPWLNISADTLIDHKLLFTEMLAATWVADFSGLSELYRRLQLILRSITGGGKGGGGGGGAGKSSGQQYGPCAFEMLPYDPDPWNAADYIRTNNCYAYASGQRKKYANKPQPGLGSGAMFSDVTGPAVWEAAKRDGAHEISVCFPDTEAPRHLVALVIWPGEDYHWYRKHPDCWGHKPGSTAARNVDSSGAKITNPQTCNRGPYTEFTGYMLLPKSLKIAA